jgi:hypothetical protein
MTERQGSDLLTKLFMEAGFSIAENHPLDLDAGTLHLDGFDPERMVGFEFITDEAEDRRELTVRLLDELDERMERGEVFVLLVDELDARDEADLEQAARAFLASLPQ